MANLNAGKQKPIESYFMIKCEWDLVNGQKVSPLFIPPCCSAVLCLSTELTMWKMSRLILFYFKHHLKLQTQT